MKSFVSLCFAISLPALALAIPLSTSDAPASTGQSLDVAATTSESSITSTKNSDTLPAVNSSALDSPFAAAHHMGHGPVVVPSSTGDNSTASSPDAFPNVVNTHGDDTNHTYEPVTPDQPSCNTTHHQHVNETVGYQVYECDQRVHIEYLTNILLGGSSRDNPGCKLVVNAYNGTAYANSSTPTANLSNPAYIGGGEAAAPPGYRPSASLESSTTTGGITTAGNTTAGNTTTGNMTAGNMTAGNMTSGNTTMVDVEIRQSTNGMDTTTIIRITEHTPLQIPDTPPNRYNDTGSPNMPPPMNDTSNSPILPDPNTDGVPPPPPAGTGNGRTPYALPPGFTGP